MRYVLSLEDLTVWVRLGNTPTERRLAQQIMLRIALEATVRPLACESDQLMDTVCYAKLAQALQVFCSSRSFNLLEHLAYRLFQFLKESLPPSMKLVLHVSKKPIMYPHLARSVFTISE